MKNKGLILAAGALLGLSSAANAQFTAFGAGPFDSAGVQGNPLNGIFTYNYAGPDFQVGNITLTGTLTDGPAGSSWLSEARYRVTTPGGMIFDSGANDPGTSWDGDALINSTQNANVLGTGGAGMWTFEFFESFNDGGDTVDAIWSNVTFDVQVGMPPPPPVPTFSGSFAGTPNVLLHNVPTSGTTIWTGVEGGVTDGAGENVNGTRYPGFGWDNVGNEAAFRIDHAGGDIQLSLTGLANDHDMVLIDASGTVAGTLAVSEGFGGSADESILLAGAAPGAYYVVVDGFGGTNPGTDFTLTYIPAPGAMALMGLGGLVAARRRR